MARLSSYATIVPTEFHNGIMRLCKKIGTGTLPIFVEVKPEPHTKPNRCFPNVQEKIQRDGGGLQLGWLIWEAPKILIEGEFHCVWKSPAGELLCISAREDNENRLVFLPDHKRTYSGILQGNIGLSWPKNPSVERFLEKEAEKWRFLRRNADPKTGCITGRQKELDYYDREIEAARRKIKLEAD